MATRVRVTALERRILDLVYLSENGFERVEDLHQALGADQHDFVDALESLEGDGYLSVSNLGGSIVVAFENPLEKAASTPTIEHFASTTQVGRC